MRLLALPIAVLLLAGCTASPTPSPVPTDTVDVVTGLAAPWSMVRLESGSTLVSERDSATIKELTADGEVREVGVVEGVVPGGEGGLLGLEVDGDSLLAYYTAADDNRVERFALDGGPGDVRRRADLRVSTERRLWIARL